VWYERSRVIKVTFPVVFGRMIWFSGNYNHDEIIVSSKSDDNGEGYRKEANKMVMYVAMHSVF
jgi:hypothetical protein